MDEERLTEIERRAKAEAGRAQARGDAATWALEDALTAEVPALVAEVRHLRAALHRMRDLGQGMSRSWYVREIDDGLAFPPGAHSS